MSHFFSTGTEMNKDPLNRYLDIDITGKKCQIMYVWVDGTGIGLRSKTKTMEFVPKSPSEIPIWNFDGSSTGQAEGENSDIYLYPVSLYKDPFRCGDSKIVLCETYTHTKEPHDSNQRYKCVQTMKEAEEFEPWIGMEQEYVLLDANCKPLGWPQNGFPAPEGGYYCAVGANKINGRSIAEAHYRACLYAGIPISGTSADKMLSQWEFQIGPCEGVAIGDDMWMGRYFMHRVAEDFDVSVSVSPIVVPGNWHRAGLHCNFSTKSIREENGLEHIVNAIKKLEIHHYDDLADFGTENSFIYHNRSEKERNLKFESGVGLRRYGVRIPSIVYDQKKGYFEDRRPCSNADPYKVAETIVRSVCLRK